MFREPLHSSEIVRISEEGTHDAALHSGNDEVRIALEVVTIDPAVLQIMQQ